MQPPPLWPCMCHMLRSGGCRALNYVQTLAVPRCHEPGYRHKSETRGLTWPFVFRIRCPELAAFLKWLWSTGIQTLLTPPWIKTRGSQVIPHNGQDLSRRNSSCIVLIMRSLLQIKCTWKPNKIRLNVFFYVVSRKKDSAENKMNCSEKCHIGNGLCLFALVITQMH